MRVKGTRRDTDTTGMREVLLLSSQISVPRISKPRPYEQGRRKDSDVGGERERAKEREKEKGREKGGRELKSKCKGGQESSQ